MLISVPADMLKHGISYCPYCRRPFRYAGSYDHHLALKHESNRTANNRAALWITSTTRDSQEDSDYEDPPLSGDEVDKQEPEPELHDPGRGFEDGGEHHDEATARFYGEEEDVESDPEDSIMVPPGPPATSSGQYSIERYPRAGEPIGEGNVTDVTGRTDRGTRQTCKRGQEQDLGGARLDWDWTRRYFVSRNTRQDGNRSKGRNV